MLVFQGWNMYAQLLINLFKFLVPFLRNADLAKPTQLLYKVGSLLSLPMDWAYPCLGIKRSSRFHGFFISPENRQAYIIYDVNCAAKILLE